MPEGEVAAGEAVAAQLDQRGGDHGEVGHADGEQQHNSDPCPADGLHRRGQLHLHEAAAPSADQIVALAGGDVVLQHPHAQADAHQHRGQRGGLSEVDGRDGGVAVNLRGEHLEADAPAQGGGRAVFGDGLDEHQQRADGVVAAEQRREDLPHPLPEARAEHRAGFLQAGGDVQHGVFQHGQHEGKHVQAHDQHQSAQREEPVLAACGGGQQLLEQAALLHEQNPAHGGNVGRGHEGDHEDDVKCAVAGKAGSGEKIGQGRGNQRGKKHHQHAQQQGIADHRCVFALCKRLPRRTEVKAAIHNDRPGKDHD